MNPRSHGSRVLLRTTAAVALLAALTACGDDTEPAGGAARPSDDSSSSSDAGSSAPASPAASSSASGDASAAGDPAATLKILLQAYTDGDAATACPLQTAKYTKTSIAQVVSTGVIPAGSTCEDTVRFSGEMAKKFKQNNAEGAYDVTSNDGTTATVVHEQGGTPVTYTMKLEDGGWKLDAEG